MYIVVTNNVSEGSCVSQGGTASYKKKMKSLYIRTTKCHNRHKNIDYWYLLNKYSPKTLTFDVFFTLWMKSLIKMQKLNNWSNWFSAMGKKKALSLKILLHSFVVVYVLNIRTHEGGKFSRENSYVSYILHHSVILLYIYWKVKGEKL